MLTEKQLSARKIGGSDVATILGLNPRKTAEELRLEILGRLPGFEGNEHTKAGEIFESAIADFYAHKTGRVLRRSHRTHSRPQFPWLTGHIDRDIVGERRGLEIKNVGWRMQPYWGEPGSDQIAEYYLPQPHTYMLLLDYPLWDVAAYFGGSDLRIYTIERDPEMDEIIIEATREFWDVHVLGDVPCEVDPNHPAAEKAIRRIYPGTDGSTVDLPDEIAMWHGVRMESLAEAKRYQEVADAAKVHILKAMGNAAIGRLPDGTAYTRKVVTRKSYEVAESQYVDFRHSKTAAKGAA